MSRNRLKRGAGIYLSITSLPSPYGIGTIGEEAHHFIDTLSDLRQRYWQILPVGPTSYGDSPYQSYSAFAGNPYLIDLDSLISQGFLDKEEVEGYCWGTDKIVIDYTALYENRITILRKAYQRFDIHSNDFLAFNKEQSFWLEDYSFFMAAKTISADQPWFEWETGLRNRDPVRMEEFRQQAAAEIGFWQFCQYEFFTQWNQLMKYAYNKGVKIIGDIPLYVALDSVDVWAGREQFLLAEDGLPLMVAGTPPDGLAIEGQKWGNPLYDWSYMETDGFDWWRERIRWAGRMFDIIRIDHFIGIARYYSIPVQEECAQGGRWNKGPGKKLTDVIEAELGYGRVVADDLGSTVPAARKLQQRIGWPGMKMLLLAFDGNTANEHLPHNYSDGNLVLYTGTHDSDTIVGFFRDKTDYELAFLYEYMNINTKEEIPEAIFRKAYASVADVVIMQMQDILKLGNEARMNRPATFSGNSLEEERREWIRIMTTIYRR
ncbi:4-alpha-glucanotransferase [Lachnospiraceae bacterium OttesenSCG-928-D06]|nr:4-alpha-glucanotransferase [Lachnospiraceae bacterium OttesenSCG-928-D06]